MTDRFTDFLKSLEGDTYPEPPSPIHEEITARTLPVVVHRVATELEAVPRVLDVGCGQGVALRRFTASGCLVYGITTNRTDLEACRNQGYTVYACDMHSTHFTDGEFDLIWARHVLEHSPAPLFALREFWRVLKPGGWLYAEVPLPDTACAHQTNKNHYSCHTDSAWQELIKKAHFEIVETHAIQLMTQAGPDEYRSYLCRKAV